MRKSKAFKSSSLSMNVAANWKNWFALALLVTVIGIAAHSSGRKMPSLMASLRNLTSKEADFDPYDVRSDFRSDHASNDNRSHVETGL